MDQYRRTNNTDGGGWVANTASVDESVFVGPDARVYGKVLVFIDRAKVFDEAVVSGQSSDNGYRSRP
ncbi:hypothetical protein [Ferrimicrobium acidiphilum]|uniref:hypothetical protein n=1 Tax=Ferrimicrobium acidiphilum TaxID=121039 RepID=UPI0023F3915A|nr:hypothetical protein [Ferrimicrobium acidiphilum]